MADVIYSIDAAQFASLISAITEHGSTISTAIGSLNTNLEATVTKLDLINTRLTSIDTALTDTEASLTTSLSELKTLLDSDLTENKNALVSLKTDLVTKLNELKVSLVEGSFPDTIEILSTIDTTLQKLKFIETISGQLNIDMTDVSGLHKTVGDTTGVKSLAYLLASQLELIVESKDEADKEEAAGTTGSETPVPPEEIAAVDAAIKTKVTDALDLIALFTYGVIEEVRLTFQQQEAFEKSKLGLAFDFSRRFVNHFVVPENTTVTEYAILASENTVRTSSSDDTGLDKIRIWKDFKIIQTIVVIENSLSKTALLYYPSEDSINELVGETFVSKKKAFDYAMSKYQETLDKAYLAYSFIPVTSIAQGCYTDEYREKVKLITAEIEYN